LQGLSNVENFEFTQTVILADIRAKEVKKICEKNIIDVKI